VAGERRNRYVPNVEINGTCHDQFGDVADAFAGNFDERADVVDVGASVAVTIEGEPVVDLWAGTVTGDDGVERPWQSDTIINVFSTTKTVAALACLMLADQRELDFYSPVAKYWPEFRVNGKAGVEVRHVMSHTAGLPSWRGEGDRPARCPGAVVGAGDSVGVPRHDTGFPRG
jgi:CubicO group peptidase (beta-lactamase class C family)